MAVKYISYGPQPIDGQAMLNFQRCYRLRYTGDKDAEQYIQRGMPLFEAETIESTGDNQDGNLIIHGECVAACAFLKSRNIKVDLVYIDPPFASGADYAKKVYLRRNPKVAEETEQKERTLQDTLRMQFDEVMYGDIWNKNQYLNWMYENLMAIKSVMSETASIYLHLDWHIGHYVKVLMDEVFGEANFRNEIIWHYTNKMSGNQESHDFVCEHDTIFFYSKSKENVFNVIKEERETPVMQSKRVKVDGKNMRARDEEGNIIYELSSDKKVKDVWTIPYIASTDKQRRDYATQKPEALLERIIQASSDEGMVVADFFGGSGVTAAVAATNKRKFIHCDIGINSIETTRDYLIEKGLKFDIIKLKGGIALFRNPQQTMDKLKELIPNFNADECFGSKLWRGCIRDTKGEMPVYYPDLKDSGDQLLDKAQMSLILDEMTDLPITIKKVIVYYVDIDDKVAIEQFINEQNRTDIEVELRTMSDLLDDVVADDNVTVLPPVQQNDGLFEKQWKLEIASFHSDRVMQAITAFNAKGLQNNKNFREIVVSDEGLETIEWLSVDCTHAGHDDEWHSDSEVKIYDDKGHVAYNGKRTKDFWNGCIYSHKKPLRLKIRNICGDENVYMISNK